MKIKKLQSVTFFIFFLMFLSPSLAYAGSSFLCVDDKGNESITDYPIDGQNCKVTGELKEMTTEEKLANKKGRSAKEIKRQKEFVREEQKPKEENPYQECLKEVKANYTNYWIDNCHRLGLSAGCALPSNVGAALNSAMEAGEKMCFEKYPPSKQ